MADKILNPVYAKQTRANMVTGSYHLANNPKQYEIQRNNTFELQVTGLDGLKRVGTNTPLVDAGEVFRLSVTSAPIPHFTQEAISIRRGNSVVKYAGVPTFDSGNLTLNDYIGADTKAVLLAWQALAYDVNSEYVGVAASYKKTATLIEYSPDYRKVREWTIYGCWISGISENAYDQEDGGKHQITATIQYDRAIPLAND